MCDVWCKTLKGTISNAAIMNPISINKNVTHLGYFRYEIVYCTIQAINAITARIAYNNNNIKIK